MPIYEFCCRKCGRDFEELVSLNALKNGGVKCVHCGSKQVDRLLSPFSFRSGTKGQASMGKGCGSCSKTSCSDCG